MRFDLKLNNKNPRKGIIETPHGSIKTPFFMPVGTVGSVKGVSPEEIKEIGYECVLSNTYHLFLRPGEKSIKKMGGLHKFMGWNRPILTDSGGYQVFSLGKKLENDQATRKEKQINSKSQISNLNKPRSYPPETPERSDGGRGNLKPHESLVKITPDGVEFKSHLDGSKHFFTPEKVVQIQLDLGVDMIMPLDVCLSGDATTKEIEKAVELTIKWAARSRRYFDARVQILKIKSQNDKLKVKNSPGIFGIVQGGLDRKLRKYCAKELIEMDFDGYAVGGLAVDLETRDMWGIVKLMGEVLPKEKPRYLMGVGTPSDIEKAISLGIDMFDCVLPTRLARHGAVFTKKRKFETRNPKFETNYKCEIQNSKLDRINLLQSKYRTDKKVIEKGCGCYACRRGFSRAYIAHLIREREMFGMRLATLHNLYKYKEVVDNNGQQS